MGYDETFQSLKSRVIVLSFQSTEKIAVKVGNSVKTDMNEKCINLMMADYLRNEGAENAREDENVVVLRKYHEKGYANTYSVVNKTNAKVEVTLDMTSSDGCDFTPSSGVITEIIDAHTFRTIGASIMTPGVESFGINFEFSSRKLE